MKKEDNNNSLDNQEIDKKKLVDHLMKKLSEEAKGENPNISKKDNPKLSEEQMKQFFSMMQQNNNQPVSKIQMFKSKATKLFVDFIKTTIEHIDSLTKFILSKKDHTRSEVVDSARGPIIFGTYIIIIFVVIGGLWAAIAPLDSASTAMGVVAPENRRKDIIHKHGGTIKQIFVKTGDHIKQGDPILEFDPLEAQSLFDSAISQYRLAEAAEDRVAAEHFDLKEIKFDEFLMKDKDVPEVQKIMKTQIELFESNKKNYESVVSSLQNQIEISKHSISSLEERKKSLKKNAEFIHDKLNSTKKLFDKGYMNRSQLLDIEAKASDIDSNILNTDTDISKARQEILVRESELAKHVSDYKSRILREYHDAQAKRNEAKERYIQLKDNLDKIIVRSPVDGVIIDLKFTTIGSFIPGQQILAQIAPNDEKLIIDARIPSKYIDKVEVGLKVKIRFSAFKSRTTPVFTGTIVALSPDTVEDQQAARDFKPSDLGDGKLFIAKIDLDMDDFDKVAKQRNLKLIPGMQAEVQIVTGTRTLLRYLLDPVTDNMFKSFNER